MKNPKILIQNLNPKEKNYKEKLNFLVDLVNDRSSYHILNDKLVVWAKEIGLKPELSCEDRTSWWTCSAK